MTVAVAGPGVACDVPAWCGQGHGRLYQASSSASCILGKPMLQQQRRVLPCAALGQQPLAHYQDATSSQRSEPRLQLAQAPRPSAHAQLPWLKPAQLNKAIMRIDSLDALAEMVEQHHRLLMLLKAGPDHHQQQQPLGAMDAINVAALAARLVKLQGAHCSRSEQVGLAAGIRRLQHCTPPAFPLITQYLISRLTGCCCWYQPLATAK